jgi:recombination protein RecA
MSNWEAASKDISDVLEVVKTQFPDTHVEEIVAVSEDDHQDQVYKIVTECQQHGGICAWMDTWHALDPIRAGEFGVDIDNLYIAQPETLKQCTEITESLLRSECLDIVAVVAKDRAVLLRGEVK